MDLKQYLKRIGYNKKISIDQDCLKEIHINHVSSIPFENLDIQLNKRIDLSLDKIFQKVITNKRGGYCYELNYLFNWFLTQLGFKTTLISARIYNDDKIGPEYDHLAIQVELDRPCLVDVGYGDLFKAPIQIISDYVNVDDFKKYKLQRLEKDTYQLLESLNTEEKWQKRYAFNLNPCTIMDFEKQHIIKQLSEESFFVKNTICTLPFKNGRKTIFNNIYKIRTNNTLQQIEIKSDLELKKILEVEFGIFLKEKIELS